MFVKMTQDILVIELGPSAEVRAAGDRIYFKIKDRAALARRLNLAARALYGPVLQEKTCLVCKKTFKGAPRQVYCSNACKVRAYQYRRGVVKTLARRLKGPADSTGSPAPGPSRAGECEPGSPGPSP